MNNKLEVIGIDHGWSMMKTVTQVFVTGVKEITTTPALFGDVLEYDGKYYKIGTVRQEVKDTKVEDDSFYLLTLAAVAKELKKRGLSDAKVFLAVGLPLTRFGAERNNFIKYLTKNKRVDFRYENEAYHIEIDDVAVFPQCYAAVVDKIPTMAKKTLVVDIGSWTIDIMPVINKSPDESKCVTVPRGLITCMYYFHSNKKMKPVSKVWIWAGFTIAAIIWTFVSSIKNPYLNLATLLIVLILLSFYYESGMWTRIINIVTFMGIGMLFEPVALLLLHAMNFHMGESYKYYFVMVICSFVRGNVMYILSKLISKKGMQIADFPKEILGVLVMVFAFTVLNCCFVILLSLEAGSEKSLLMCASIVISIVLTDYFMLYMMERFNYLVQKQYEDAMYREEMHYKDIYYEEAEKQNKEVQKLKHDMKHKLHELYHLVENSDGQELSEKIGAMCKEFEQIDEKQYSDNPIVDSVLRIKFGRAKARGIKVETSIRIPKQMQLDHGDIGVLYGNLVDNAVEACSKVPEGQRFVKIENKYQSGILLLIITNSKTGKKNKSLKTTKKDNIRHGHGVQSVRKVIEKYNGTVSFTDKGDIFEVSAMLYGIEVRE